MMRRIYVVLGVTLLALLAAGCGVESLEGVTLATPAFVASPTAETALVAAQPTTPPPTATPIPQDEAATETPAAVAAAPEAGGLTFGALSNTLDKDFLGTSVSFTYPANWQENESGQFTFAFDPDPNLPSGPFAGFFIQLTSRFNLARDAEALAAQALASHLNSIADIGFAPEESRLQTQDATRFTWGDREAAAHAWLNPQNNTLTVNIAVLNEDHARFIVVSSGVAVDLWPQFAPVLTEMLGTTLYDGATLPQADIAPVIETLIAPFLADIPADVVAEGAAAQITFGDLTNSVNKTYADVTLVFDYPANWQQNEQTQFVTTSDTTAGLENAPYAFALFGDTDILNVPGSRSMVAATLSAQIDWLIAQGAQPAAAAMAPEDAYIFQWGERDAAARAWLNPDNNVLTLDIAVLAERRFRNIMLSFGAERDVWAQYGPRVAAMLGTVQLNDQPLPSQDVLTAANAVLTPILGGPMADVDESTSSASAGSPAEVDLPVLFEKDFVGRTSVAIHHPQGWQIEDSGTNFTVFDPATGRGDLADDEDASITFFYQVASQYGDLLTANPDQAAAALVSVFTQGAVDGRFAPPEAAAAPDAVQSFTWGSLDAALYAWRTEDGTMTGATVGVLDADHENVVFLIVIMPTPLWETYQNTLTAIAGSLVVNGEALPLDDLLAASAQTAPPQSAVEADTRSPLEIDLPGSFTKAFFDTEIIVHFPHGWQAVEGGGQSLTVSDPAVSGADFTDTVGVDYFIQPLRQFGIDQSDSNLAAMAVSGRLQFGGQGIAVDLEAIHSFTWGGYEAAIYYWQQSDGAITGMIAVVLSADLERAVTIGAQRTTAVWQQYGPELIAVMASMELDGVVLPAEEFVDAANTTIANWEANGSDSAAQEAIPPTVAPTPVAMTDSDLPQLANHNHRFTDLMFNYPAGWETEGGTGQAFRVYDPAAGENGPQLKTFILVLNQSDYAEQEGSIAPYALHDYRARRITVNGEPPESNADPEAMHTFTWGIHDAAMFAWQAADGTVGLSIGVIDLPEANQNQFNNTTNPRLVVLETRITVEQWAAFQPVLLDMLSTVVIEGEILTASDVQRAFAAVVE